MAASELVPGHVPGLLLRPKDARSLYVLAHGAGAGMRHPFMEAIAQALAERQIATFRWEFSYLRERRGRPDPPAVAVADVRAAVAAATSAALGLPLFAGGKSFGGRMTSTAQAEEPLPGVRGLVFLGWPLHPPKMPSDKRAAHLPQVKIPMLFLQGTRDDLADLTLLQPVCQKLGTLATLHIVDGADHSFHVLKKSGRTDTAVLTELGDVIASWSAQLPG